MLIKRDVEVLIKLLKCYLLAVRLLCHQQNVSPVHSLIPNETNYEIDIHFTIKSARRFPDESHCHC